MWSHYANGHKGCSLQIELPNEYFRTNFSLRPVEYGGIQARNGLSSYEGLYVKDKKWKYELEERAVWNKHNYDPALWNINGENVYLNVRIKAVILGCMAHEDRHYLDALKAIKNYNETHKTKIVVRKLTMMVDKFKFIKIEKFDYLSEIK